tara:strand:+ start:428 stop:754 length:327 start_codon:yes stop_codon:yes gene_type:complete
MSTINYVPITGKPLNHLDFIYQLQLINEKLTGGDLVKIANDFQKKYEVCIGGPRVIEEYEKQYMDNITPFIMGGLVDILKELELSHNRKKISILDGKVLDNNEPASTK